MLKCCKIVLPNRMNFLWIIQFFISCARMWRNMATISSISMTPVDANAPVVLSGWHRMEKHLLFILVLWRQTRLDLWIRQKYINCLILCLVSKGVCCILLWSFTNNFNVISNWHREVVNTVSMVSMSCGSIARSRPITCSITCFVKWLLTLISFTKKKKIYNFLNFETWKNWRLYT